jgi:uncharacterized metal-binding protein
MTQNDSCCTDQVKTLIMACSGGSNVGQISNSAMVEMDKQGVVNAYCLAGVGAELSGFLASSKAARIILIDGCPIGCGKKILEKHAIEPARYFVVSEFGVEKKHAFDDLDAGTKMVLDQIICNI